MSKEDINSAIRLRDFYNFIVGPGFSLINTLVTNIMTRKQELSVLQSIGMTKRQLNRMVQCEAGLIAAWNIIITFLAGGLLGFMLIRGLNSIGMSYLHWAYPIGFALFYAVYRSYHASNYNKGNNLSPSEKVYCGEITGNRIKRLIKRLKIQEIRWTAILGCPP